MAECCRCACACTNGVSMFVLMRLGCCLAKRRPPSDSQIRKHRDQMFTHRQWKDDTDKIRSISSKLGNMYASHKGDFALGRYEELKQMIKNAIKEYHELMEKTQKQNRDGAASAIASKYSVGSSTSSVTTSYQNQAPTTEQKSSGGLFSKLKKKASDFSFTSSQDDVKKDKKNQNMDTWGYEGRNAKDIEEETESMRKEVLQLKKDFRSERDKLDRLAKEYEDSKKHTPPTRYTLLKEMIKDVTS